MTENIKTSKKFTKKDTIPIYKIKRIGLSIFYLMKELVFSLYLNLKVSKRMSDIKIVKIGYKIPEIRQKIKPKI
jgi:hypothetical protein